MRLRKATALILLAALPACSQASGTARDNEAEAQVRAQPEARGRATAEATAEAKVNGLLGIKESPSCEVTAKLIPSCGAWWGIAPEIFTGLPPDKALERAETRMGRTADVLHVYHRGKELFPNSREVGLARDPDDPRLLLINWKPSFDHTWAAIADGALDKGIDRLADHIRKTFPERFFLTVHHEPEDDVRPNPGSGMTAADYAAMYRHVVQRLRERGVKNAVTVMTYMGAPNWASQSWFEQLYPGDDVVDWVAMDPYADARVRDFDGLVNKTRKDYPRWPGFYRWMQWRFPGKPIMIAEWGVFSSGRKRAFFESVRAQVTRYPQIKALVYFDSPHAPRGDTRFDTDPAAAHAFTALAEDPHFSATRVPRP
ncbi:glycoside hydrolase family 26 protein [Nonomuraea sp. NPDC059194]|uniref:glycoside hydrolase family 26 protein n=1 Tax=Nonomuraea sp. NPDC059194 TaxID=3346764 RepID=UPI0036BAC2C3